ncbi:nickel-dependent lactate racemase [Paenibacillus chartarius]|uniref:Nickel-dependent lactate racemase n=1 Tax=Paenibacillus chartarius TaxID=747481 RepID=A0ABV6DGV9_9BACL
MILLPYGHETVELRLPASKTYDWILYPGAAADAPDALTILENALARPYGTPLLAELAQGRKSAVILISDSTRLSPSYLFLPLLIRELVRGGLRPEQLKIVVALGMHRKQTEEELRRLVGDEVYSSVRVYNHSALEEDCIHIGSTSRGTPVIINRLVVEADLRIATGNIEPHSLVGMSGGVKALVPGVAARETIERNHSLSQRFQAVPGDPDNPVHRDLEEAQELLGIDFLYNVIVNHRREPLAAVAGHVKEAHAAGVEQARRLFLVEARGDHDIVVVSPGGYPKDMQLYQTCKAMINAAAFTKPGGAIVAASRCQELFGNGTLQYWIETIQDRDVMAAKLKERFVLGAHKTLHIQELLRDYRVYLYSDMPAASVELTGFIPVTDLDRQLEHLFVQNPSAKIGVMPYGGLTYPK